MKLRSKLSQNDGPAPFSIQADALSQSVDFMLGPADALDSFALVLTDVGAGGGGARDETREQVVHAVAVNALALQLGPCLLATLLRRGCGAARERD